MSNEGFDVSFEIEAEVISKEETERRIDVGTRHLYGVQGDVATPEQRKAGLLHYYTLSRDQQGET